MPQTQTTTHRSRNKTKQETTLRELLETKLKALYDIENQLVKALPKMAKSATDADLRGGFEKHLEQTKGHVERLEREFEMLGLRPQKLACDGIRGIIADAEWVIKNVDGDAALDANLIAAGQYAEHYEMAGYQSAIAWAKLLEENDIADLLQETYDEEKQTSDELADLANSKIDEEAKNVGEEDADGDAREGKDEDEEDKDEG